MRHIPFTHQLETTDEQFLASLKLPGAAHRRLRQGVRRKEFSAARAIVADHFRTRTTPAWSYYSHGSPWHQTDAVGDVLDKGRHLLKHRFRNSWAPHQWIDLSRPGKESARPDWRKGLEEAPTSIARFTWLTELTTAFAITGDTRFAAKAMQLSRM